LHREDTELHREQWNTFYLSAPPPLCVKILSKTGAKSTETTRPPCGGLAAEEKQRRRRRRKRSVLLNCPKDTFFPLLILYFA
jgi:hypothetical protein